MCGFGAVGVTGAMVGAALLPSGLDGTITGVASSLDSCLLLESLRLFRFPRILFKTFSACFASSSSNESFDSISRTRVSNLTAFFSAKLESGSIEVRVNLGSFLWLK